MPIPVNKALLKFYRRRSLAFTSAMFFAVAMLGLSIFSVLLHNKGHREFHLGNYELLKPLSKKTLADYESEYISSPDDFIVSKMLIDHHIKTYLSKTPTLPKMTPSDENIEKIKNIISTNNAKAAFDIIRYHGTANDALKFYEVEFVPTANKSEVEASEEYHSLVKLADVFFKKDLLTYGSIIMHLVVWFVVFNILDDLRLKNKRAKMNYLRTLRKDREEKAREARRIKAVEKERNNQYGSTIDKDKQIVLYMPKPIVLY